MEEDDSRTTSTCSRALVWCVDEPVALAADGSEARFHHGRASRVGAGDDEVLLALVATEDMGMATYIELQVSARGRPGSSVWLRDDEAHALAAQLESLQQVPVTSAGSGSPGAYSKRQY